MEMTGLVRCTDCAGISTSSPAAGVKGTDSESPYRTADATTLRRVVTARGLSFFQAIFLSLFLCRRFAHLTNWICGRPRAIAVAVERLRLKPAPPPIARGFAGQFPECRG